MKRVIKGHLNSMLKYETSPYHGPERWTFKKKTNLNANHPLFVAVFGTFFPWYSHCCWLGGRPWFILFLVSTKGFAFSSMDFKSISRCLSWELCRRNFGLGKAGVLRQINFSAWNFPWPFSRLYRVGSPDSTKFLALSNTGEISGSWSSTALRMDYQWNWGTFLPGGTHHRFMKSTDSSR